MCKGKLSPLLITKSLDLDICILIWSIEVKLNVRNVHSHYSSRYYTHYFSGHVELFPRCSLHFSWVSNFAFVSLKYISFEKCFIWRGSHFVWLYYSSLELLSTRLTLAWWIESSEGPRKMYGGGVRDVLGAERITCFLWRSLRWHLFVVFSYRMGGCKEYGAGLFFEGMWCFDERQQMQVKTWELFVRY